MDVAEPADPVVPVLPRVLAVHRPTPPRVVGVVPRPRVAGAGRDRPLPTPRRSPEAERLSRDERRVP